jgi:TolB protein
LTVAAFAGLAIAASAGGAPWSGATGMPATPGGARGNGLIAFVSDRDGTPQLYTARIDGSAQTNLSEDPGHSDSQPSWSPDGTRLAFTSDRTGDPEVWVMNADGSGQLDVSQDPGFAESDPAFSPIDSSIAFTSDRTGDTEVFVQDPTGGAAVDLTLDPGHGDGQPAWAPDGSRIAFTTNRDGDDEIYVMLPTGSDQTNLSRASGSEEHDPEFSVDGGTRVAFTTDRTGDEEVSFVSSFAEGTYGPTVDLVGNAAEDSDPSWQPLVASPPNGWPIEHVVVIFPENHSFDEVLGKLCVVDARCDGTTTGTISTGATVPLARSPDIVPDVSHAGGAQDIAIDGGRMDRFDLLKGCHEADGFACYTQYWPKQIPALTRLAREFVISDHTFESAAVGSFGAHINLVASILDGFTRGGFRRGGPPGPGWGCDSGWDQEWFATSWTPEGTFEPTCIPQPDGSGPYRESAVPWVPTIMDRLQEAGLTWKLYAPQQDRGGYVWSICPVFAECLYTTQNENFVAASRFAQDATAGRLSSYSVVVPPGRYSQHNKNSMMVGDNWMSDQVTALMNGPDWATTALFITYDDCGCFYDHVPPPPGLGIRVPMVIVSPYARPGFTDQTVTSYASVLALVEHVFGLAPLAVDDRDAYDYAASFDFGQTPRTPVPLPRSHVPRWILRYIQGPAARESQDDST